MELRFPAIEQVVNWFKNRFIYMTGRGLLGLGLFTAVGLAGLGSTALMVGAIVGTVGLQTFMTWRNERRGEERLVTAYREEVAAKLEMPFDQVKLEHLRDVAFGHPELGLDPNPVLQQALERNSKRHVMQLATSALAGVVTLGTFAAAVGFTGLDIQHSIGEFQNQVYRSIAGVGELMTSTLPRLAGTMFIAGTGMGIFNQLFDQIGNRLLGMERATTNQLIMDIKLDMERGKIIPKERVFGVFVSANEQLDQQIETAFGKTYEKLTQRQQHLALLEFGKGLNITQHTYDINHRLVEPEELAFTVVGQSSGVPRKEESRLREEAMKETTTKDILQEVSRAITGKDTQSEPANDNQPDFAKRFAPRKSEQQQTHAERVAAERPKQEHSFAEREQARAAHLMKPETIR